MSTNEIRIPVLLTGRTLQSLRDSGYSLPAAIAEVVDNSLEAKAREVRVLLMEGVHPKTKKKHIHQVAVVDDGQGMQPDVLAHYLQLGFSTRYMSKTTIGKYGVGAKLAALNFATRVDVWTRVSGDKPWSHTYFDLAAAIKAEDKGEAVYLPGIDEDEPVPADYEKRMPSDSGTLVLWSNVDRLDAGRWYADAVALRINIQEELARTFRYFIDGGVHVFVDDTKLLAQDPLFLMSGTFADSELAKYYGREEGRKLAKTLRLGWFTEDHPKRMPAHFAAEVIADEELKVGKGTAHLRVTLYPREITRARYMGDDELATKINVKDSEGLISFVRLNREVSYTNVPRIFPRGVETPDRFIGIEVSFSPELDEYFGVRNVKRGVEPHDALRDEIRKLLKKYVHTARNRLDNYWNDAEVKQQEVEGSHTAAVAAATVANQTMPGSAAKGPEDEAKREKILDDLATDLGYDSPDKKKEYLERIRGLPFVVENVSFPGKEFIEVQHLGNQVIIRINTRHRFYQEVWAPIEAIADADPASISGADAHNAARRTKEALALLLIAYGKAESMDEDPRKYSDLRSYWGTFLHTLIDKLK